MEIYHFEETINNTVYFEFTYTFIQVKIISNNKFTSNWTRLTSLWDTTLLLLWHLFYFSKHWFYIINNLFHDSIRYKNDKINVDHKKYTVTHIFAYIRVGIIQWFYNIVVNKKKLYMCINKYIHLYTFRLLHFFFFWII